MKRLYKSGSTWALWRWSAADSGYIDRLHIIKTPWFAVCLHWLNHPDPEPYQHDHPVTFLSLILRGGYSEWRGWVLDTDTAVIPRIRSHRWYNFLRATDKHRIVSVKPRTVTLALMGPKVREWGFHTERGWVMWKDYYAVKRAAKKDSDARP